MRSRFFARWRQANAILGSTLLLLGLAEGAARVAERLHPSAGELTFEYAPYRMLKMARAPWGLNRDGFRARELETYGHSFLIEFLGGSVCLGVGTDAGQTLPERFEEALRGAGLERVEVLNLCQGGATSAQELAIFLEYGWPLAPQAVLSFDGANDVLHPRPIGDDSEANLPYRDAELRARVNGEDLLRHLALARVAARLAGRWSSSGSAGNAAVKQEAILNSYGEALSAIRTLAEAHGGFYALLLQPTLHYGKPWSAAEADMWRSRRPRDGEALTRIIRDRYGAARDGVGQWAARSHTRFYDLTGVFAHTDATIYSDSVHFRGPQGYALLFDELAREGLIDRLAVEYRAWDRNFEEARLGSSVLSSTPPRGSSPAEH